MVRRAKGSDPMLMALWAGVSRARRNTSGDPKYHSGRKKKEYDSPYLEFLDKVEKTAQRMPQVYEFDLSHGDGTRYADWVHGERILNEIIHECQQSLDAIQLAKLDQEARQNARAQGFDRP